MDLTLYEEVLDDAIEKKPMVDKEVLYIQDLNGGSYNGQITFDTSSLTNSGRWLAYKEATLQIPFIMTWRSAVDNAAAANSFMVGLKNGFYQIIDSIQVDYNNTNVIQLTPFTNFYVNYKLMTTMSQDDVVKYGSALGFYPDTAQSYQFLAAAADMGDGYSNNSIFPFSLGNFRSSNSYNGHNAGLFERMKDTSFYVGNQGGAAARLGEVGIGGINTINTQGEASIVGKSYCVDNGTAGAGLVVQWNVMATIRLKDVSDFFEKMPLVKGGFMRMIINYNSNISTITSTAAPDLVITSITQTSGNTNPMMFTSAEPNNPNVANAAGLNTIACGVGNSILNRFASPLLSSCRLYVPSYQLDEAMELSLLNIKPERKIIYNDIYNYTTRVGGNSQFNQILTNGIANPKYVVILPFANPSEVKVYNAVTNPVWQSPFDSSPATTTPMAALTNFNVQVAGKNIFQQNFQYDYEAFLNEVSKLGVNGGVTVGLASGLIGKKDWDNAYRYYIADVSRRELTEDGVSKSITIVGTNATNVPLTLVCFIVFEREIVINMSNSEILKT